MSPSEKKKATKDDKTKSKLHSDVIDLQKPLSIADWENLNAGVKETEGLAFVQVLPVGQKSVNPLQFNTIHLCPGDMLPLDKVPLCKLITDRVSEIKKKGVNPMKHAFELN